MADEDYSRDGMVFDDFFGWISKSGFEEAIGLDSKSIEYSELSTHFNFKDLTGKRFGRLVVLGYLGKNHRNAHMWHCLCDCSVSKSFLAGNLTSNANPTVSCGCKKRDSNIEMKTTHGLTRHPCYKRWAQMIRRCTNKDDSSYSLYGGRGITVCERWMRIENFIEDMGCPPFVGAQIDRKNNNDGYYKCNCLWRTSSANCRNTRRNRILSSNGISMTMVEWAESTGINYDVIRARIDRLGWSVEDALSI